MSTFNSNGHESSSRHVHNLFLHHFISSSISVAIESLAMQKVTYEPSFRFIKIYTCVIAAVFPTEILEGYRMNQFFPR